MSIHLTNGHVPAPYPDHAGVRYVPLHISPGVELMSRLDRLPLLDPFETSSHLMPLAHDYTDVDCMIMLYACIFPLLPLQEGSTQPVTTLGLCRNRSYTLILILMEVILMKDDSPHTHDVLHESTAIHHEHNNTRHPQLNT